MFSNFVSAYTFMPHLTAKKPRPIQLDGVQLNWTDVQPALWAQSAHLRSPVRQGMTAVIATVHHGHTTVPVSLPWHCMGGASTSRLRPVPFVSYYSVHVSYS